MFVCICVCVCTSCLSVRVWYVCDLLRAAVCVCFFCGGAVVFFVMCAVVCEIVLFDDWMRVCECVCLF